MLCEFHFNERKGPSFAQSLLRPLASVGSLWAFPPDLLPPLCPGSPPPWSPVTSAWPNSVDLLRWPGASAGSSLLDAGRAWSHCRQSTLQCGGLSTVSLQSPTDSLLPVVLFSLFGHVACGILVPPTRDQTRALVSARVGA